MKELGMFEQGDKVVVMGEEKAEVQFGPVTASGNGKASYLVKWLEGKYEGMSSLVCEAFLTPAPKFKVGQKVRFAYTAEGVFYEVVAGPFPDEGESFWVYKDSDGNHDTSYENHMVPVVE